MEEREVYAAFANAMHAMGWNIKEGDACLVLYAKDRHAFKEVDELDLKSVPNGTIIHFTGGASIAATYFLQIVDTSEGRRARMWKHTHAPHLESSVDDLVSFYEEKGKTVVERGMLKKGRRFLMPYFEYETIDGVEITKRPTTEWFDVYESIKVLAQK